MLSAYGDGEQLGAFIVLMNAANLCKDTEAGSSSARQRVFGLVCVCVGRGEMQILTV